MTAPAESGGVHRDRPAADWTIFGRLWRFIQPHWRLMIGSLLLLPLASGLQLLPPILLKGAIDEAIVAGDLPSLAPYAGALVATLLLQQLAAFGQTLLMQLCGQRAMHDLRVQAHAHVLHLRVAFFDRTPIGRTMTRITNDIESIAEAFSSGIFSLVGDGFTLLGIVVAMLLLDARLALLTFAVAPLLAIVVLAFQRALRRTYRLIRLRLARINGTLQEQINGIKVVQIFAQEVRAARAFDQVNRDYRDAYRASIKLDAGLYAIVEMFGSLTVALLLWYGGRDVIGGGVTFGLLVAFIEYVQKFFVPIRDMSAKYAVMQQAMAASERVFELLDTDEADGSAAAATPPTPPTPPKQPPASSAKVRFEAVHFAYAPSRPILRGVSFSVARGENIAIVGASGAGKSTLIRLLTRLYEIDEGAIFIDGVDIRQRSVDELRRQVVVLSQDVFLFTGTILDNIKLEDPAITDDAAFRAATRVGITDLVPLDTEVDERGSNLSAGERQLVVFARALARSPEILVLDEATASVDPASEAIVQRGIAELMRERTAIVIAHRLTTIEAVDRVLVFSAGALVEEGEHQTLLARPQGHYRRLHDLQYVKRPAPPIDAGATPRKKAPSSPRRR